MLDLLSLLPVVGGGAVGVAGLYGALMLLLFAYQRRLIFRPSPTVTCTPADLGLAYDVIQLPYAQDREWVQGWWIPSDRPHGPTVLYLHGNGINMGANVNAAARFHALGLSVFMIDYRGYGESSGGFPSEQRVYEDADRAWHYLTDQRQIAPEQMVLYGHSLGGAIAIELATRHPDVGGLVIESSFTSMREMVTRATVYDRLFPIDWILTQRFDSLTKVRSLTSPVIYIHGTADPVVPPDLSAVLHDATAAPAELVWIPEADHNNVAEVGGDRYRAALIQWLQSHYPGMDSLDTYSTSPASNVVC
ncbi:MAG: alpha/beta fold hydrolase [Leptolyngbya sp. DLM2.Bin15]|nr:MAG: alpha/beta fold hydrolase [Leptolyngbya sp. DLM2.Bin15]